MACRAVHDAVRSWHNARTETVEDLVRRIEPIWLQRIAPSAARDCAATCLFALAHASGHVHVAGIGDGMALLRTRDGLLEWVVGPRTSGFANETEALGQSAPWACRSFAHADGSVVLLASDGVADDLLVDRIDGFLTWLMDEFATLSPSRRWRMLRRELTAWPTPGHTDDKTLVVLAQRKAVLP